MKHILTTTHSDLASGCTTFDNGTRVFWTEGRSSAVNIIHADGKQETTDACDSNHPIIKALMTSAEECGYKPSRSMTKHEEAEIAAVRGWA